MTNQAIYRISVYHSTTHADVTAIVIRRGKPPAVYTPTAASAYRLQHLINIAAPKGELTTAIRTYFLGFSLRIPLP